MGMTIHEKLNIIMQGGLTAGDLISSNIFWTITSSGSASLAFMKINSDCVSIGTTEVATTHASKTVDLTPYTTLEILVKSASAHNTSYYGCSIQVDGVNITGNITHGTGNKTYTYDVSSINKEANIVISCGSGTINISSIRLY